MSIKIEIELATLAVALGALRDSHHDMLRRLTWNRQSIDDSMISNFEQVLESEKAAFNALLVPFLKALPDLASLDIYRPIP